MIEVQVKTITSGTWPLGSKGARVGALTDREWYVFVLLGRFPERPRTTPAPPRAARRSPASCAGHGPPRSSSSPRPGQRTGHAWHPSSSARLRAARADATWHVGHAYSLRDKRASRLARSSRALGTTRGRAVRVRADDRNRGRCGRKPAPASDVWCSSTASACGSRAQTLACALKGQRGAVWPRPSVHLTTRPLC